MTGLFNPLAKFYEWYLTFFTWLPLPFRMFHMLVWGLITVFAVINVVVRYTR